MKAILEFLAKNNRWAIVLVILLFVVGGGLFRIQQNRIKEWKNKHETEVKLKNALLDSVTYYQNAYGNEVAEKLTIQESVKNLEKMYGELTDNQRELVSRVKELNKSNTVITAALIKATVKIDSLLLGESDSIDVVVDTINKVVHLDNKRTADSTTNLIFDIDVKDVLPAYPNIKPSLMVNSLDFPNTQLVTFEWKNDKKRGYPISFSTENTNKYYKTQDMNSYAIPQIHKKTLDPTGWQKVGQWFNKNGKIVGFVAGGVAVGAGATYIIMQ